MTKIKNLDSLQNIRAKKTLPQKKVFKSGRLMDGILIKQTTVLPKIQKKKILVTPLPLNFPVFQNKIRFRLANYALVAVVALVAFGFGAWYELSSQKTLAETPAVEEPAALVSSESDELFSAPIQSLKDYVTFSYEQNVLDKREQKLKDFLAKWDSPLESQAGVIARQSHWKLILAISFAESTLGKNCVGFNCSGIGGSNIREYKSFQNWILGFNRLIENRYKDKSLEQMCGVYVQPCNKNWLLATGQMLRAIDEAGIE